MNKNKKSMFMFFLKMLIIFLVLDVIMSIAASSMMVSSFVYKYGRELVVEIFYAISILIVMLLFKNSYVFSSKRDKFISGIMLALPMLIMSIITFFANIISITDFSLASFINMLIFSIFIGIAEEFLCRGWLLNEFLERFSNNKKEVIRSIVLSSLVFGFIHIVNLNSQTVFETILQIINAASLGLLLGSVYYKTKNIWSVIFLHAFYDFAIMLGDIGVIKDCTYNNPSLGITIAETISIIVISAYWILSAMHVINKCDFNERPKKKHDGLINTFIVILFVVIFIPYKSFINGYDNYLVCYKYNEIEDFKEYTTIYPTHNSYEINSVNDAVFYEENNLDDISLNDYKFTITRNRNQIIIKNVLTNYEKVLTFSDILDFEVYENKYNYSIVIQTSSNESTIYYSNYFTKDNMSNDNEYLDDITFTKYVLPEISALGYIVVDNNNYPYMVSSNYDRFVIVDGNLYHIKQK